MLAADVTLDDKYTLERGRAFMTGVQALVRLPMLQRQRDLAAGLNTAGFVSGYRGSPLGPLDNNLWRAARHLKRHHVVFKPGLNEDMAATAIWGSQHTDLYPGARYDGVFAYWYGKAPGVDRSGDVFKHGNFAGTSRHGGVLLVAGDDHGAKSSSMPVQSEQAFVASFIPVLNPSSVQEYLDLGIYGWALSRYASLWVGFKALADTVESSAIVEVDPERVQVRLPDDFDRPDGLSIDTVYHPINGEARLLDYKLPAAHAFVRANPVDRVVMDSSKARLGIVTTGKAYLDVRQAFDELGIDAAMAEKLGIRLYKVALTWPLEPVALKAFARGLEEILVIEEKHGFIEDQIARLLFNEPDMPRRLVGKRDEAGRTLLSAKGELTPRVVAEAIAGRVARYADEPAFAQRLARLQQSTVQHAAGGATIARTPFFCSGCPHNTSTKLPEGSRAMAGIGCHAMAMFQPSRRTEYATHMGGEGVNWIGLAPFTDESHIFANLGDGTYYHSGILAIRAAVAAKVNITYKILFNDAVAMTGGQPLDEPLTVPNIARQVAAEGVARVVVVSDEPDKYPLDVGFPAGTDVRHRDELDQIQRDLRATSGVTVLIYDQTCAAEKRRRRKRGTFPDPDRRVFINDLVCEGCGDCSVKSNCVSVQPLETEFGRKRKIDQSNCNKDFSCLKGFCPSFVTVEGGRVRRYERPTAAGRGDDLFAGLPMPERPSSAEPYGIVVTGVGGTGVITIGALLGMAARLDDKGVTVLDQTGLAQKNGAVASHVRIADRQDDLHAVRMAAGGARLLIGCDIVVAAGAETMEKIEPGATHAVVNTYVQPPAAFVMDNAIDLSARRMTKALEEATGPERAHFLDGTGIATALMGDAIATNLFMVGYAFQKGLIPLSLKAIDRAIELNGVAIETNRQSLAWGRLMAHDPEAVLAIARPLMRSDEAGEAEPETLARIVERRAEFLVGYQDRAYADRYRALVERVARAEEAVAPGRTDLAVAVARNYFKLLACKDEYEVARLHSDPAFRRKLEAQFEGDFRVRFHLAPPLFARRDPDTGELRKSEYGPWMIKAFALLARLKHLRGTRWDVFGLTAERRMERRLVADYEATVDELLAGLDAENHPIAVDVAGIPDMIRGFGHVKHRNVEAAREKHAGRMADFRDPAGAAERRAAE